MPDFMILKSMGFVVILFLLVGFPVTWGRFLDFLRVWLADPPRESATGGAIFYVLTLFLGLLVFLILLLLAVLLLALSFQVTP